MQSTCLTCSGALLPRVPAVQRRMALQQRIPCRASLVQAPFTGSSGMWRSLSSQQQRAPVRSARRVCPAAAAEELVDPDPNFRIEKISFGKILTPLGLSMLTYGFGSFFNLLPGGDVSSLLLIYGFVISLLGFALAYAQLVPVPCQTRKAAFDLREEQATDIQKQVREDVTRYRYGDEQHLDEALDRVFRFGKGGSKGVPRRFTPSLQGVREEVVDEKYALVLEFAKKPEMSFEEWTNRQEKFQSFFGPGVIASLQETKQGVDVTLVCDGSGAGRGGVQQKDVLPPLTPGSKPRSQQ